MIQCSLIGSSTFSMARTRIGILKTNMIKNYVVAIFLIFMSPNMVFFSGSVRSGVFMSFSPSIFIEVIIPVVISQSKPLTPNVLTN